MKQLRACIGFCVGLIAGISLAEPVRSVPGTVFSGPQTQFDTALRLDPGAARHAIALPTPDAIEQSTLKSAAVADKRVPLQIGFAREIPANLQRVALASLEWQTLADGNRVAQLK